MLSKYQIQRILPLLVFNSIKIKLSSDDFTNDGDDLKWSVTLPNGETITCECTDKQLVKIAVDESIVGEHDLARYQSGEESLENIFQWVMQNASLLPLKEGFPTTWEGPNFDLNEESLVASYDHSPDIWMQISVDDITNEVSLYWGNDANDIEQHFTIGCLEFKPLIAL